MQGGGGAFDNKAKLVVLTPVLSVVIVAAAVLVVASSKCANGRGIDDKPDVYRISGVGISEDLHGMRSRS